MGKITIKSVHVENFQSWTNRTVELSDKTLFKGENGVGKSTFEKIIKWVLIRQESANDKIRPHDENGNDIEGADTLVQLTLDVDGREITLERKQRYTKGGSKVNNYAVNDIPKGTEKDYVAYISENILDTDLLLACMSIDTFFEKSVAERRNMLLQNVAVVSNEEVIASDEKFAELTGLLKDGTPKEILELCKKRVKDFDDETKAIPVKIETLENQKADIDVAELELERNGIKEKISEKEKELDEISKQYIEFEEASKGVLELKFEISDLQRKANENLISEKKVTEDKISRLESAIREMRMDNKYADGTISDREKRKEIAGMSIERKLDEIKHLQGLVFDDSSLVCPTCGKEYDEQKKQEIKAEFERTKESDIESIEKEKDSYIEEYNSIKAEIETLKSKVDANKKEISLRENEVKEHSEHLNELPKSVDISDDEQYIKLSAELKEKESFVGKCTSLEVKRSAITNEKQQLLYDLSGVESKIAMANKNNTLDEEIMSLNERKKYIAQEKANMQRISDLVKDFRIAQAELLQERVDKSFSLVKWKLFTPKKDGELKEICQAIVNGSNFEGNLNLGHRFLAAVDILSAFQKANDVELPMFIDNLESIDEWRLPAISNQMVFMKHTDDKELVIENI